MTPDIPAETPTFCDVMASFMRSKPAAGQHNLAIKPVLDEVVFVVDEIGFCTKVADHVRLFWNQIASPGGPEPDAFKWPELDDLVEGHRELSDAISEDLAARSTLVARLKPGVQVPAGLDTCVSDCSEKYVALQISFADLIEFFRKNLPASEADPETWGRFYYFLTAQIDDVQSKCSDAHASLSTLAITLIRLVGDP